MGLFRRNIPDIERNLSLQIIEKSITEIKPYEKNPRKNDEAVEYVANSIKEFGFKVPIVIDKNNVIVAGHTRYKAAQELGLEKLPCIIADDLTEEQVKAFRLADNKVGELAEWDFDLLDEELDGIFDIDMSDFGFDIDSGETEQSDRKEVDFEETISVVIDCENEEEAEEIFEKLQYEGYECREKQGKKHISRFQNRSGF